ncbi:MAG: tRNA (N6-isopentenyl adenosine(37)-C2)-methylthiotransferase MiaB, partial [Dehalococcoidia bacterium]|nr:tRNA (N6-isopentenyl adenosine(37)-C2)-methylthiotransferase MiaB [Dehalococcoidia bacterium]
MEKNILQKQNKSDFSYHIWTVGCQMNKSDSERLATGLEELGLQENNDLESSDVIVLNTCVVRQSAEDTATGLLGKLKKIKNIKPETVIGVMGCMVGPNSKTLSRRFPHVDAWAIPQEFEKILDPVAQVVDNDLSGCAPDLVPGKPKVATFIPIIHGCDKFCSFCIIPYRRGRETSRTIQDIYQETKLLIDRGVKEVTLLGQNVDSYGHDLNPKSDLADLFYSIHDIEGLERIRFLTSHPNDMSIKIIEAIRDLPKVCETINLPFQAGDDEILKVMRRGYSREEYFEKVDLIRETIPNVSMTTDLIIGFPDETESQFHKSVEVLEKIRFDKVHASIYSERPGTIASRKYRDNIPKEEKKRRMQVILNLQEKICLENNIKFED